MSDTTEKNIKESPAVDPRLYATEVHDEEVGIVTKSGHLHTDLKGRHMQMIAIGKSLLERDNH